MGVELFFDLDGDGTLTNECSQGTYRGKNGKKSRSNDANSERKLDNNFVVFVFNGDMTNITFGN